MTSSSGRGSSRRASAWLPTVIFSRWKPCETHSFAAAASWSRSKKPKPKVAYTGTFARAPPSRRHSGWPSARALMSHSAMSSAAIVWLA